MRGSCEAMADGFPGPLPGGLGDDRWAGETCSTCSRLLRVLDAGGSPTGTTVCGLDMRRGCLIEARPADGACESWSA